MTDSPPTSWVYPDPSLAPWPGFALAADAAVQHLDAALGLDLWLVTAVEGDQQVVVAASGNWAQLASPGTVFSWQDSLCLRMIDRQGPTSAADVRVVPAYAQAATGVLSRVRAYVGVPLVGEDGRLFGTLCAFAGDAQPDALGDSMDLVRLVGRMLSTILAREQFARERSLEVVSAHALAGEDSLTGLRNRRGWLAALEQEHDRVQRYGSTASVLSLQVHGLGGPDEEDLLARSAQVLASVSRPGDALGRVGGDEFGLLAVHCDATSAQALLGRLCHELSQAGLGAATGVATHLEGEELVETWHRAEAERQDQLARLRGSLAPER
ncbi:MAG: hypothetical protein JWN08_2618 [Frankiales bacterium]|nr:hypothetical protein [Frankiales bacterium]